LRVLIDSSIWIAYFSGNQELNNLDHLIDENLIVANHIILSELIPFLKIKNEKKLISLLRQVELVELNIDWDEIIHVQTKCLRAGNNGIGIPDLIITQNAIQNNCSIYSLDKHFKLLNKVTKLELYE